MYKTDLDKYERVNSYFQYLNNGLIKHYATGLYVMSEGSSIENGLSLALKKGDYSGFNNNNEYSFTYNKNDDNLLIHNKSGLYVQTEGNAVHNGAMLLTYPLTIESGSGGSKSEKYIKEAQFTFKNVNYNEVESDLLLKKQQDDELKFLSSSDGLAKTLGINSGNNGNDDSVIRDEVYMADPALIKIGRNRLIIATFSDPVLNLSLNSDTSHFSLTDDSDDNETWSIQMAVPDGPKPKQKDCCYGTKLKIINKNGLCLSCMSTNGNNGKLISENMETNPLGITTDTTTGIETCSIWNVLMGERNLFYISNDSLPYIITRNGNDLQLLPKTTKPEDNSFWNFYNQ
jgi:hypothetical protein